MEGLSQLNFSQDNLNVTLNKLTFNDPNIQQVAAHCRRDHLSPTFYQGSNHSSYKLSYTPTKYLPNYNQNEVQKGLQHFRKHQNSTSLLPTISTILERSQYKKQFSGHSIQKVQRAKQRDTFFLKSNWALDPTSNYQKDYKNRDGTSVNKFNGDRPERNQIHVLNRQESIKRDSSYKNEFKPIIIKKEAQLSIGSKDHLQSKENYNAEATISEYQRRYDSLMVKIKPKDSLVSIYKKETIVRNPKGKV